MSSCLGDFQTMKEMPLTPMHVFLLGCIYSSCLTSQGILPFICHLSTIDFLHVLALELAG